MKTNCSITVKNKRYVYSIEGLKDGLVYFECTGAGINQRFAKEDLAELLIDLPTWVLDYQAHLSEKKETVIRFRIKAEEKVLLEKKAHKAGFNNLSRFIRSQILPV